MACQVAPPSTANKRQYQLRKRAEDAAATRRRITEAAVELHGLVGPAHTTISGIARRAGVTRVTVYKHFPTIEELFGACSAHWLSVHPWPDVRSWEAIVAVDERLVQALNELYGFFRTNEAMVGNLHRDLETLPAPNQERLRARPAVMAAALMKGRRLRGRSRRMTLVLLTHAVEFETWRSLAGHGLSDGECVEMFRRAVSALATGEQRRSRSPVKG